VGGLYPQIPRQIELYLASSHDEAEYSQRSGGRSSAARCAWNPFMEYKTGWKKSGVVVNRAWKSDSSRIAQPTHVFTRTWLGRGEGVSPLTLRRGLGRGCALPREFFFDFWAQKASFGAFWVLLFAVELNGNWLGHRVACTDWWVLVTS